MSKGNGSSTAKHKPGKHPNSLANLRPIPWKPGQSGNPDDPHYRDLFEDWANDRFHPVVYSRDRVEAALDRRIELRPLRR